MQPLFCCSVHVCGSLLSCWQSAQVVRPASCSLSLPVLRFANLFGFVPTGADCLACEGVGWSPPLRPLHAVTDRFWHVIHHVSVQYHFASACLHRCTHRVNSGMADGRQLVGFVVRAVVSQPYRGLTCACLNASSLQLCCVCVGGREGCEITCTAAWHLSAYSNTGVVDIAVLCCVKVCTAWLAAMLLQMAICVDGFQSVQAIERLGCLAMWMAAAYCTDSHAALSEHQCSETLWSLWTGQSVWQCTV